MFVILILTQHIQPEKISFEYHSKGKITTIPQLLKYSTFDVMDTADGIKCKTDLQPLKTK